MNTTRALALGLVAASVAANPASAQKSKDTLRIAFVDPISGIDIVHDPKGETNLTMWAVFDRLVRWDVGAKKLVPGLAESWRRIDPTTLEFKLRRDVKFHDGTAFDADDVVYTLNWLSHPKTRYRAKTRANWIAGAEKVDPYTVRVKTKKPFALSLMRLAISLPILPSDSHGALKAKREFGRTPIGTGPYRAVSVSPKAGIVLERNDGYRHGNSAKPAGRIGRIEIKPIPDAQTRLAELFTGGVDVITNIAADQSRSLAADPRFGVTVNNALHYLYVALDAKNRSGIGHLSDIRVRKAVFHAIDREKIRKDLVHPDARPLGALCIPNQVACSHSTPVVGYDPGKSKALLAEVGLAAGFDVEITTFRTARHVAEGIAGYLRRVGIKAKVSSLTFGAYRKKQRQGKINILVANYSMAGIPDVGSVSAFYFGSKARDMYSDKTITGLTRASNATLDPEKRTALLRQMLDRINDQALILPISTNPTVFVHGKDVLLDKGSISSYGADIFRFHWAK